ncbi:CTP synthase [Chlorobium phaeobacteroides]|uniref:CTP synthase n=1 Tax=Chlorobium phaeobacteroides (strain DSM 266 / SMG 266 / 2430) TaxID=290317 RepID=PYRG_CHLPD|nr:CTP synthase [Chlorobium phaeobacteroides]A1BJR8.1 RecName: Full=CTP synthase; AltName: Full=Cytidine 5'-triphosphate synthase; AltName: Full=Cytidine triphosphate synthetase; Short=CTP synthetase; Short=CTPS; AltName: Full=UTP--ammonia ligase [Chlorobium phaeobacteroides DSM 266]ABL66645.1 CTP synthase [Chlorobium phaeobacteroides DSM 266]
MARPKNVKHIFVTGGVISSLGKGILSASLGMLLKSRGLKVAIQKYDPYINVDPGTMSPYQHGEVYVTDDGAETDLDLGHYERFLDEATSQASNLTMGRVYKSVIDKERSGEYLGGTVQVVPHVIDEIKDRMAELAKNGNLDVLITEIGGTIGDIESLPFLEAMRQMKLEMGERNLLNIHLTFVPYIKAACELKTKPTQHSVKMLLETGIQPDILVCRSEKPLSREIKNKVGHFCNVNELDVIGLNDCDTIYEVPLMLLKEKLDLRVMKKLGLKKFREPNLEYWRDFCNKVLHPTEGEVTIGVCGKYTEYPDAYKSILEAFIHAGASNNVRVTIKLLRAEDAEAGSFDFKKEMQGVSGVLVAPGFGDRGIEGKISFIRYAREQNIPFFGICLGMQCATIEFARNVCGLHDANSTEFNKRTRFPVIDLMEQQKKVKEKGGTMRLGSYPCIIKEGSKAYDIYKKFLINERHRHRFEFNNTYRSALEEQGMVFSGTSPNGELVEIIELKDHRWFVGVQFHPELKSRVQQVHPLFHGFVAAAKEYEKGSRQMELTVDMPSFMPVENEPAQ